MTQETLVPRTPDEQVVDAMAVMEQIREAFRLRRGQAPAVRNDFHRHMDGVHLKQLQHLANVVDVPIPHSHRKKVGRFIMLVRRVLWKLLTPITRQQSDLNKAAVAVLNSLLQDREVLLKENRELRDRLDALEALVAKDAE